ncbi:MAG: ATP-binding cassette domain-containing protein [Bacilli bacterium]
MIEFRDVSIFLLKNERPLLKNFNFVLNKGDKIAIIGEEGNGKSTLLKAIYNPQDIESYCHLSGFINTKGLKIGYLEQQLSDKWDNLYVDEYFLKDNPHDDIDYDRYNKLGDILKILADLNIKTNILDNKQKISSLSGGEKVKLQLAKIIASSPDVLLLDEPTNDLDIETLEWLELFINDAKQPVLFISHDETLLENVTNGIIHLEQIKKKKEARHVIAPVSYCEYVIQRKDEINKQNQLAQSDSSQYQKEMFILKQIKEEVRKANPERTNRMDALIAQEKKLANRQRILKMDVEEVVNIKLVDGVSVPRGKVILDYQLDNLNIKGLTLATNINLNITGPEHIAIIGQNGVGKTTLMRQIYVALKDREDIKAGYMPQDYDEMLNLNQRAIDFLTSDKNANVRTLLGSMKFTSDEMIAKINQLSNGQKAKLFLLKMIIEQCNVLLLDEPTRNLSPLTNPAVRELLKNFQGAIISISHDRRYLADVCDLVYELKPDGLYMTTGYKKTSK